MLKATQRDIDRFMSKVDKLPNGCWFWTGGRSRGKGNSKWYGSFSLNGNTVRAHRFSSEVLNEDECPPGHHRDHTCDFSMCVCPDHIEVVTHEENQRRKMAGRGANWVCPCTPKNGGNIIINSTSEPEPRVIVIEVEPRMPVTR